MFHLSPLPFGKIRTAARRKGIYLISSFLFLGMILLCSCSVQETLSPPAPPAESFQCRVQAKYHGEEILCTLSRTLQKKTSIAVQSPQQAQGLCFSWNGDGFSMEYAGLSVSDDTCPLPEGAFPVVLHNAVEAILSQENLTETEEGWQAFLGTTRLYADLEHSTGEILHISIPALSLEASFLYDV